MKKLSISLMVLVLCLSLSGAVYSKGAIYDQFGNVGDPAFYGVGEYCRKLIEQNPEAFDGDFNLCVTTVNPSYAVEHCHTIGPFLENLGQCVSYWKDVFNSLKKELK